jgi:putative transposase
MAVLSGPHRRGPCTQTAHGGADHLQNEFIESFNGKFRDKCLNEHWFLTAPEAQLVIEAWRREYNKDWTHSTIGDVTPQEFIHNYLHEAHQIQEFTSSALVS